MRSNLKRILIVVGIIILEILFLSFFIPILLDILLPLSKIKYQMDISVNYFFFLKIGVIFSIAAFYINQLTIKYIEKQSILSLVFQIIIDVFIIIPISVVLVIFYNNIQLANLQPVGSLINKYLLGALILLKQTILLIIYGKFFGDKWRKSS